MVKDRPIDIDSLLPPETTDFKSSTIKQAVENADRVKAERKVRVKKATKSYKPLKFEQTPGASPIKAALVEQFNARDLTYDDLKDYCANMSPDPEVGKKSAYNFINSLRSRPSMMDDTVSILCDFLGLSVVLHSKEEDIVKSAATDLIVQLRLHPERKDEILDFVENALNSEEREEE